MREVQTAAPADIPVTVAQAKAHARISTDADDPYIRELIDLAVRHVEDETNRALYTQTWARHLDDFPRTGERLIWLDKAPVASVSSITYLDTSGATQTLAASQYRVDTTHGRISEAYDQTWPETRDVIDAVTVTYVAGASNLDEIPAALKHAVLMLVAELYNNRDLSVQGTIVAELKYGIKQLIAPHTRHLL